MQYNKTACLILGVAALTLSSPSFAQATTSNDSGSSSPEISTRISIKHVDQADIDGSAASMEYTEVAAGMEWQFLVLDITTGATLGEAVIFWEAMNRFPNLLKSRQDSSTTMNSATGGASGPRAWL